MQSVWQDIRYSARVARKHPGAAVVAVLSLAIGVGANSVVFSLVDGMFLRSLPVRDSGGLVRIDWRSVDGRPDDLAWTEFESLRASGGTLADLAVQNRRGGLLDTGGGELEVMPLTIVSDNYFPLLGIEAARGRLFREDLDAALKGAPAIAITDGLWRRRFGADPDIVGRTLRLNNRPFTIVGVLPAGFRGLDRGIVTDLWVPATTWRAMGNAREFQQRVAGQFEVVGRLRPGAGLASAQAHLDAFADALRQERPGDVQGRRLVVRTQAEYERTATSQILPTILLSIAGQLVIIACANVAQLLLALAETRRREVAIRQALGASRGRLIRQMLTESAILAGAGAVVALLVARWLIPLVPSLLPPGPSFVRFDIRLDLRVVAATLAMCMLAAVIFGLVPALRGSRSDINAIIKSGGWETKRRWGGRRLLVVSQAMLGVTLLSVGGLLALSFARAAQARPGFDIDRQSVIMLVAMNTPRDRLVAVADEIAERVAAQPGLVRAAYARRFPMSGSGGGATRDVVIPGRHVPPDRQVLRIRYNQVSPDYFAATGTRVLVGRGFSRADADGTLPVAMVNDTMARQFWPAGDVVGSWIRVGGADVQIVGVVENGPINSFHESPQPFLYFPFAQLPAGEVTFVFEGVDNPASQLPAIRRAMRAVAPAYAQLTVNTLRGHVREALYQDWLQAVLSIALAVLGMVLAAVGLTGVVIHSVLRRTREIGVRTALGARRRDIVVMVLREGLVLVGLGGLLGVGLSLAAGKAVSNLLYGVNPFHPGIVGSSLVLVVAVALVATAYPAWKATRVDPVRVLRAE
ncbi:MAG: ABC transporter permease [Acidobacteriota bacterium]